MWDVGLSALRRRKARAVLPLGVGMVSSSPWKAAIQAALDRMAAVGVDRELVVAATSRRSCVSALGRRKSRVNLLAKDRLAML